MVFSDIEFGYSDADTELIRKPQILDKAFFDPNNYLNDLLYGDAFLICGRKGDGKTAYSAKIRRMAMKDLSIIAENRPLENLNNSIFDMLTSSDWVGGKRYLPVWKCILLIEVVRILEKRHSQIQTEDYAVLAEALRKSGFIDNDSLRRTIVQLNEMNATLTLGGAGFNKKWQTTQQLVGPNRISKYIFSVLRHQYLDGTRHYLIIDGIDDILRTKDFKSEILTGLLRAASEINNLFYSETFKLKIIILIRDDIYDLCRDPDISKIRRDSIVRLNWKIADDDIYSSNLMAIIKKRFEMSLGETQNFNRIWLSCFPAEIDGRDSLSYMLENTLYKPRDVVEFFREVSTQFPHRSNLSQTEFKKSLKAYSENYFIDFMKDELTGFISDECIDRLSDILSDLDSRRFSLAEFDTSLHNIGIDETPDLVLASLYNRGYIGQWRPRPDAPVGEYLTYKHINPKVSYSPKYDFQIHRGLLRALSL